MSTNPLNSLNLLDARIKHLMFLCDSLKQENQDLKDTIKEKNESISELETERDNFRKKYLNLKAAQILLNTENAGSESAELKNRFKKLVREIDKCIASLNE